MRKVLYWYVPAGAALIGAAVFAYGFYSFARGQTGTPVNMASPARVDATAPKGTIAPIILGDSLARGTGDESGIGIGGRFLEALRRRKIASRDAVNLAINGARTADLLQQLDSHNVRQLLGQSNVIIVSIGGNDLWGDNNWRNAPPGDPRAVMNSVLDRVTRAVKAVRAANPNARIFVIGLYNPFFNTPFGRALTPFVNDWNAKLIERFASDPNLVVVQTSDLFNWRDRLSFDRFHPGNEGYAMIARRIADTF
jgi:lysophospholipase L1-like esterase